MHDLRRLLRLDWDEIGQSLLRTAVQHLREAALQRADAPDDAIAITQTAPDRLRLSITARELIRREQGDAAHAPQPFLDPTAQDRGQLRDALTAQLERDVG
ncbi:hypothetical protein [Acidisoma silvae]|uniref:Uncharacterized protein n=1 Tax=Acidisoma silvae TaxID=2802396 RepID=A0A963YPF9_9PROT|nr:hypothetical protein [Acidisoma silvae]MCB8874768.1 hypothetical protein [Acidisoma silvae]